MTKSNIEILTAIICVSIFTIVAILEKTTIERHNYLNFTLSRAFYILLMILLFIVLYDPTVLKKDVFLKSVNDPHLILISILTSLGTVIYFWLLTYKELYIVSLLWPVITISTILAAALVLKESINYLQWSGVIMTFVGVFITLVYK